jgi:hypothetical protein
VNGGFVVVLDPAKKSRRYGLGPEFGRGLGIDGPLG